MGEPVKTNGEEKAKSSNVDQSSSKPDLEEDLAKTIISVTHDRDKSKKVVGNLDKQPVQVRAKNRLESIDYHKLKLRVIYAVSTLLVIIIAVVLIRYITELHPTKTFDAALTKSLSTQSIELNNGSIVTDIDMSNMTNPIVQSTQVPQQTQTTQVGGVSKVSVEGDSSTPIISGWGNIKDLYNKFTYSGAGLTQQTSLYSGKWVQIKSDGKLEPGVPVGNDGFSSPSYFLFGNYLVANLSSSQKNNLTSFALKNVYTFNPKVVNETTTNGQKALDFQVTVNKTELIKYNQMLASILGLSSSDIQNAIKNINSQSSKLQILINKDNDEVLEVSSMAGGNGVSTLTVYSKYNTAKVSAEPTTKLTYAQYIQDL